MKLIQDEFFNTLNEIKECFENLESLIITTIINILTNHSRFITNIFIKSFVDMNFIEVL